MFNWCSNRERRERVRKKNKLRQKDPKSRKVGTSVFFQCFVAQGRRAGSVKRRADQFWQLRGRKVQAVARSTFWSQNVKNTTCSDHFWMFTCDFVAGARDSAPCQVWTKHEGIVAVPQMMAGMGCLKSTKDISIKHVKRSGRWIWSIRSSGFLWWFCLTGAALRTTLGHFFVAGAVL